MEELYNSNKDIKRYVDIYCTMHGITKEQAFQMKMVMYVIETYVRMKRVREKMKAVLKYPGSKWRIAEQREY